MKKPIHETIREAIHAWWNPPSSPSRKPSHEDVACTAMRSARREYATSVAASHGLTLDEFLKLPLAEMVRLKRAVSLTDRRKFKRRYNTRMREIGDQLLAQAGGAQ